MPLDASDPFVESLRSNKLLEPPLLEELSRELLPRATDAKALAKELIQRSWLTPYQVNQVFLGKGGQLILGPYVLLERLGEGGMGEVYKARHQKMRRIVAVKLIRKEYLDKPKAVRRFYNEVQAAARLAHPHVVHAFDADQIGERHVLVMEYVDGTDLSKLVKARGPLPILLACDYIRQAALGLQHAHEHGLVHRDIKPSNLLLQKAKSGTTGTGPVVKVLDMGLARHDPLTSDTEAGSILTKEGVMVGTPDFIAPEQILDSHRVDIRADLYSLGATLYFLLTGQAPFAKANALQKLLKHQMEDPVPVAKLRPEVPAGVAGVVRKLMAKRPEDRYKTPGELAVALADGLNSGNWPMHPIVAAPAGSAAAPADQFHPGDASPVPASPGWSRIMDPRTTEAVPKGPSTPVRHRGLLMIGVGGAVLVVGILLLALLLLGTDPAGRSGGTGTIRRDNAAGDALNAWLARKSNPQADPVELRRALLDLRLRFPDTPEARQANDWLVRLPSFLDRLEPAKLPPEDSAAGSSKDVVGLLGDYRYRHWRGVRSLALRADGKMLAAGSDDNAIHLWDSTAGKELAVLTGHSSWIGTLAFAPGGKTLASGSADGTVRLWDVAAAKQKVAITGSPPMTISSVAFSSDGKTLLSQDSLGFVRLWDPATGKERPAAVDPLLDGKWHFIGPFDNTSGKGFEAEYPPEKEIDLATSCPGKGGAMVAWKEFPDFRSAQYNNLARFADNSNGCIYLYHVIDSKQAQEVPVWFGSDDTLTVWLNGECLLAINHALGVVPDHVRVLLKLKAGKNELLVKVCQVGGTWGVCLRSPMHIGHGPWAFSPEGKTLALGGDGDVRLQNTTDGTQRVAFSGHRSRVRAVAYSADGKTIVSGDAEGTVRLWDATNGQELAAFRSHNAAVNRVAMSPDGKTLLSQSTDNVVKVWDVAWNPSPEMHAGQAKWEEVALAEHKAIWTVLDPVSASSAGGATLTKQPDGSILASGTNPDKDTYTVVLHTNLTGITALRLEVLPDKSLPSRGPGRHSNGNFVLIEVRATAAPKDKPDHAVAVGLQNASADFSQEGWPVTDLVNGNASDNGWAILPRVGQWHWAVVETKEDIGFPAGTILRVVLEQTSAHAQANIGRFRISATTAARPVKAQTSALPDEIIPLLKLPAAQRTAKQQDDLARYYRSLAAPRSTITDAKTLPARPFTPDGKTFFLLKDNQARLCDTVTGKLRAELTGHGNPVSAGISALDGKTLFTASHDSSVKRWDIATGKELTAGEPLILGEFSPDGATLALRSGNTVKLLDLADWHGASAKPPLRTLTGHSAPVLVVAYSPDGRLLASGSADNTIVFWDLSNRPTSDISTSLAVLPGHTGPVTSLAFSPDGKTLVSGSGSDAPREIKLWDVPSGKPRPELPGNPKAWWVAFAGDNILWMRDDKATVRSLSLASGQERVSLQAGGGPRAIQGRMLALGGPEKVIRLWERDKEQPQYTLTSQGSSATSLAFFPDGKNLASTWSDARIIVWDISTGNPLRDWQMLSPVGGVKVSPDGRHLATNNPNRTITILRITTPPAR